MQFEFETCLLDTDVRELRRGAETISVEPQVFDLLVYLVQNHDRVVTKDDLIASIWGGRIVSESTLTSRINAARKAIGDSGKDQRLIRTVPRKGLRFVGKIDDPHRDTASGAELHCHAAHARTASGHKILHRLRWRAHRLCGSRLRSAVGQGGELAQPS